LLIATIVSAQAAEDVAWRFAYADDGGIEAIANPDGSWIQLRRSVDDHGHVRELERIAGRPCPLRDLDRIPLLLNAVTPRYAIEARDQGVRGTVEVQFFIDEKGTVRMPAVLQADRLDLAQMALEAVRQWKFEPPTHKGNPVMISAVQHFEFGTGVQSSTTVN
jgi:TonB family protein